LTYRAMIAAGWIAMISAFASIPVAYLSYRLEGRIDLTATVIQATIQIVGILIFLTITLYLKKLLNAHFKFHDTDKSIGWMIKANVVAGILLVIALTSTQLKDTLSMAALLIMVAQGVVQIQFGYKLLKLQNNLGGMLKPFCYANMATGICLASVILILVGVLISAISDLMLGTIFFYVAKQVREPDH
jgi:hypothetical protein